MLSNELKRPVDIILFFVQKVEINESNIISTIKTIRAEEFITGKRNFQFIKKSISLYPYIRV